MKRSPVSRPSTLLFFNLPGLEMAVSVSCDGAKAWSAPKPLHEEGGKARYSDLAIAADGTMLCLYTHGKVRSSEEDERCPVQPVVVGVRGLLVIG